MDLNLGGAVVIVTGASRGLGEAIVKDLVDEGASVVAAARSENALQEISKYAPSKIEVSVTDMENREEVQALVSFAVEKFGSLSAVVNNAGIAPAGKFVETDIEVMEKTFAVNVFAPAILAKEAAKYFIENETEGSIINIASTSGLKGKALLVGYSASKGAMIRLTEAMAAEWARFGIRVNTVAPGAFVTDAQSAVLEDAKTLDARLRKIPLRRMGEPSEIGGLVSYLVSKKSGFVTGSCFVADGGEVNSL
ncbi:MAG: 2-deoxy-D-gluconate 3-dehydrogenase [Acidimicrobiaceae bacterium]|nr:2-deoxy-D-gluconate 3-dehydrogenase [Acidimicrobiaceae bacterium]|tara:strand:+ start:484 stop:1236 length:753 start_codon:yes stop_codon:yes gene_type:complete